MNKIMIAFSIFLTVSLLTVIRIHAQDSSSTKSHKPMCERFYIYAGAYRPTVNTEVQINSDKFVGTVVSLEDNFGFEDHPWLFKLDAYYQMTKRSSFSFYYTNLDRKSNWIIDRDVNIFDTTFYVGADLGIYFNTQLWALTYRWNFFVHEKWDAGLSFGLRLLKIKTGVELNTSNFDGYYENITLPVPAPIFGIYGRAFMTDRLMMRYNFDYFTISIDGFRANVIDNRLALEYYLLKNVGLGASFNFLGFRAAEIPLSKNFNGEMQYKLHGFNFYLAFKFK